MKSFTFGCAITFGLMTGAVQAQQVLTVDGTEYLMSDLMAACQSMTTDQTGQIACFSNVAKLLEDQTGGEPQAAISVTQALDALRSVAEYEDDESGLIISGSDCFVQVLYFNNYFHISRRNISTIDVFSAKFDASNIEYDQIVQNKAGQAPLSSGVLGNGGIAVMQGGLAMESAQNNFEPRSPGTTLDVYAQEVVDQLATAEGQTFDFVLVHPQHSASSGAIWTAFERLVDACKA